MILSLQMLPAFCCQNNYDWMKIGDRVRRNHLYRMLIRQRNGQTYKYTYICIYTHVLQYDMVSLSGAAIVPELFIIQSVWYVCVHCVSMYS